MSGFFGNFNGVSVNLIILLDIGFILMMILVWFWVCFGLFGKRNKYIFNKFIFKIFVMDRLSVFVIWCLESFRRF